jgi:DNA-binding NtrC family response regulator
MFSKSIAIVNDDQDLLNMYSEALQMSGYDVSSFADPVLAYEHIKENPNKYSLVIIYDDKMPDMNGLFFSTKLLEINPKLNLIIISDYFANDLEYNYKFNILKKRISILKLISVVNESISKSIAYDDKL